MIASQFNLDHRLAELRPSEADLRIARERRDAGAGLDRIARATRRTAARWLAGSTIATRPTRLAAR